MLWFSFGQLLDEIGRLFQPSSGHTERDADSSLAAASISLIVRNHVISCYANLGQLINIQTQDIKFLCISSKTNWQEEMSKLIFDEGAVAEGSV